MNESLPHAVIGIGDICPRIRIGDLCNLYLIGSNRNKLVKCYNVQRNTVYSYYLDTCR